MEKKIFLRKFFEESENENNNLIDLQQKIKKSKRVFVHVILLSGDFEVQITKREAKKKALSFIRSDAGITLNDNGDLLIDSDTPIELIAENKLLRKRAEKAEAKVAELEMEVEKLLRDNESQGAIIANIIDTRPGGSVERNMIAATELYHTTLFKLEDAEDELTALKKEIETRCGHCNVASRILEATKSKDGRND